MSAILIFAAVAAISATGVFCLFAYRLQWIKKIRISFPEMGEPFIDPLLRRIFGNGKIERYASRCWDVSQKITIQCAGYLKSNQITSKIKDRTDRFFGKRMVIPDRETSSAFLRSIAEHKKKAQEESGEVENRK